MTSPLSWVGWSYAEPRPQGQPYYDDWVQLNRKILEDANIATAEGAGPAACEGKVSTRADGSVVHPVLLVPGICGSILTVHQRGVPPWRAWIVLEHSDDQFRYLLGRFDPENGTFRALSDGVRTGATLSHAVGDGALREAVASPAGAAAAGTRGDASRGIGWAAGALLERARSGTGVALGVAMADADDNPDVTIVPGVPGDDTGLAGISVLDPDMIAPVNALHYYYDMIKYLESQGYVDGQTLFGFPFDFRQSNRAHCTLDLLESMLETAYEKAGGCKVDIVSHSMGGLVIKAFLALRPQVYERLVRKWITVATPFQGAPGYGMDALTTGVKFVSGWEEYFFVHRDTFRLLAAQSPAMFELLPPPGVDLAHFCGRCRDRGCSGPCVVGHHGTSKGSDPSLVPCVTVWVKEGGTLHRTLLEMGATPAPDDVDIHAAWPACPCCQAQSSSQAPASAAAPAPVTYSDVVSGRSRRVSAAEANAAVAPARAAPPACSRGHVAVTRAEAGAGRAECPGPAAGHAWEHCDVGTWCPKCRVHARWDLAPPRTGAELDVSVSRSDVDVDVRVGPLAVGVTLHPSRKGGGEGGQEGGALAATLGGAPGGVDEGGASGKASAGDSDAQPAVAAADVRVAAHEESASAAVGAPGRVPQRVVTDAHDTDGASVGGFLPGAGGHGGNADGSMDKLGGVKLVFPLHGGDPAPEGAVATFLDLLRSRMEQDVVDIPGMKGRTTRMPFSEAVPAWAAETRAILKEAELPEGCAFMNICGYGQPTPVSVEYGSKGQPLDRACDLDGADGTYATCEGDGVVPLASAYNDGLRASARVTMKGDHRGILVDPAVMRVVLDWLTCEM